MSETLKCDVAVVGAGPGGYAAAFLAADLGKKVVLLDASPAPGGVCLQRGCIPSKTLLHFAKLIHEVREAREHGLDFGEPKIDLDGIRARKNKVISNLTSGIESLCRARGVRFVKGRGKFTSSTSLSIEGVEDVAGVEFEHCVVAVGSRPVVPTPFQIGDRRVMDSTGALEIEDIPGRLLVIGGGYIGLELGSVYQALGSKVTVVEMLDGLLMGADRDLVKPLEDRVSKLFEAIYLRTKVAGMRATDGGIEITFEGAADPAVQLFDRVLISTGRRPNNEDLGLETTKAKLTPKGFLEIDKSCRTTDPHIYAIGDIAGEPMLAHKASAEARVAVESLCGQPTQFDHVAIPAVVFTDPEIAWVGVTEAKAEAEKMDVRIARFPWSASGRAQSLGRTEGLTKVIYDRLTERIIGIGIVGSHAGEMIAEGTLAVEMAAQASDLSGTIHAHPTLSETLMESAEMLHGASTHIFRKKK